MTSGGEVIPPIGVREERDELACPVGCGLVTRNEAGGPCFRCRRTVADVSPYSGEEFDALAAWLLEVIMVDELDALIDAQRPDRRHDQANGGWCGSCAQPVRSLGYAELRRGAVLRYIYGRHQLAHWVSGGNDVERGRAILAPLQLTLLAMAAGPYQHRVACPVDLPERSST